MTNKQKLVLRINELFHDIEGEEYQKKHSDIFTGETNRWKNAAKKYFTDYLSPVTVLDIGSGTGFVPLTVAGYLSENDQFICSDISNKMLNITKENLKKHSYKCKFSFLKTDGNKINPENITIVTMNSVLHHIPNFENLFRQISKIVTPGGRIIIGHEPNKKFYQQKFLLNLYLILTTFSSFKTFAYSTARFFRLNILLKKFLSKKLTKSEILSEINLQLLKEGIITKKLTDNEINQLVDYHSPSAGSRINKMKGIDIEEIRKKYLPNFEPEYFETYNFISKMSDKNALMKKINTLLSEKYKEYGATFFAVLKKKSDDN